MPQTSLRKVRTESELIAVLQDVAVALPRGEWFVEQHSDVARFFSDEDGHRHVADLATVHFLDGLAHRTIVFVSWG
jgi:hypothetical protein